MKMKLIKRRCLGCFDTLEIICKNIVNDWKDSPFNIDCGMHRDLTTITDNKGASLARSFNVYVKPSEGEPSIYNSNAYLFTFAIFADKHASWIEGRIYLPVLQQLYGGALVEAQHICFDIRRPVKFCWETGFDEANLRSLVHLMYDYVDALKKLEAEFRTKFWDKYIAAKKMIADTNAELKAQAGVITKHNAIRYECVFSGITLDPKTLDADETVCKVPDEVELLVRGFMQNK